MASPDCPWCDRGFTGDVRGALERGWLLAPLVWRNHDAPCAINLFVRERGAEGAEVWLTQAARYVQGYVVKEAFRAE